jgi:hypothetical protein
MDDLGMMGDLALVASTISAFLGSDRGKTEN